MCPLFKGLSCKLHRTLLLKSHWQELSHVVNFSARSLGNTDFVTGGYVFQVKSGAPILWKKERMYFGDD